MTFARLALVSLVTGVSPLAIAVPAHAQTILFATALNPDGSRLATGQLPGGPISVRGGITQLRMDDGAILSFVGDAAFDRTDGGLRIAYGSVSVRAGETPLTVTSADGSRVSVTPGSSASLALSADGGITGRALTGRIDAVANGESRSIAAGSAFAASAQGGVSSRLSLAPQPVDAFTGAPTQAQNGENPLLPRLPRLFAPQGDAFTRLSAAGLNPSAGALALLVGAYLN
ncbi:MAG: hypothetical protein EOP59_12930, partial [Sphingomonadales bacterium]